MSRFSCLKLLKRARAQIRTTGGTSPWATDAVFLSCAISVSSVCSANATSDDWPCSEKVPKNIEDHLVDPNEKT